MLRIFLLSALIVFGICAQTKVDLQNQSRGVDFSAAPYTKPAKTGSALPPTCTTGEAFVLTSAVPGSNFFICTATNAWTRQGSNGAGGDHSQLTHLDYASSGHTGFQPALGFTPLDAASLGQPNGPAKLGSDGRLLASQISGSGVGSATISFATEQATGTGSATFTLTGTPVAGSLIVAVNGQVQEPGGQADYTLSGSAVTFNAASIPAVGARISFRYGTASAGATPEISFATEQTTGDGTRSGFTLAATPMAGSLTVAVNGQIQEPGAQADYQVAGSAVTFNGASIPPAGARMSFRYGVSAVGENGNILISQLPAGVANGLATLGADGKVPSSQLPASQGGAGGLTVSGFYLTDGTQYYCGSTQQPCTRPVLANFSGWNLAGASTSTAGGAVTITVPEFTGNGYHGLAQSRGSSTTLIARLLCDIDEATCAVGFGNGSGGGHVLAFYGYSGGSVPSLGVSVQYVSGNGTASVPAARWMSPSADIWVKAVTDGTTCDFYTSLTGQNWRLIDSRACYASPSNFIAVGQDGGSRRTVVMTVLSWQVQ